MIANCVICGKELIFNKLFCSNKCGETHVMTPDIAYVLIKRFSNYVTRTSNKEKSANN